MTTGLNTAALAWLQGRGIDPELADRLGLETAPGRGGEVIAFPFMREGKIVRRKYRRLMAGDGPKWSQDAGEEQTAFNEDCLRDDSLLGQPVIITEGEADCIAAIQAGFPRCLSVPGGAPKEATDEADLYDGARYAWLRSLEKYLHKDRAPEIILATDGDSPGAALMQDLATLLGRARCKFLTYPKARDEADAERLGRLRVKDLGEVLERWGENGVRATIGTAEWLKIDGVFRMSELPPVGERTVWDIGFHLLGQHMKMRTGDTTIVTGIPSYGKSTLVNDLVCRVVRKYGVNAAWASFEQEPQIDHRRNLRKWFLERPVHQVSGAELDDADKWIDARHRFFKPSEDEDVTLEWMLEKMAAAVIQHDCRIIVIDPWNEMDHSKRHGESTTEYVGRALRALNRFRRAFDVHLIIVAHPTKSVKDPATGEYRMPTLYDISDSAMFNNKADVGIIVHRSGKEGYSTIKVAKSRYHDLIGPPGAVLMDFSRDTGRFIEIEKLA